MSAPIMGAVGIGSSLLGGLFGAAGAEQSAAASSKSYAYQAGLAALNARIAEQNSNYAIETGELQAAKYGLGAKAQAGQVRAGLAASGLDVNTGSAKEVQTSQHTVSMMDMDTIRRNAAKTAYDYRVEGMKDTLQMGMYDQAAQNAKAAGGINALSSLIGAAGSVASKWSQAKQSGMFG